MTESAVRAPAALDSPAAALERRFESILREHMQDVPLVNPVLRVQAVGFTPWEQHWLGILVTPWFMNLMLFPRLCEHWPAIAERESRHYVFPAGVFEFIGSRDAVLGDYQACSLFSPMFEFAEPAAAHDTAVAALAALFDSGNRPPPDPAAAPAGARQPVEPAAAAASPSKRDFLFGAARRADRGP